jgi:hypothetical protein
MSARLARLGLLASFAVLVGCASAPPPAPTPPPPAPPAPPPPVVQEPDLSPVSEPPNLLALGRWKSASGSMRAVEKMLRLPVSLQSLAEREIGDPDVVSVLKLDSSVDVAVALDPAATDPDFFVAFSIPLKNLDQAKSVSEKDGHVTQLKPGVFRIGKPKQSDDVTCDLSVSVGDAPARLVCGQTDRDLDALMPWLTRGMPTVDLGANDVHMELRFGPLQERFAPMLSEAATRGAALGALELSREFGINDPAIADMMQSTQKEGVAFAQDLDVITVDAKLDPDASVMSAKSSVKLKGQTSWFTKVITARGDRSGGAPPIFLQAPKDSETAFYARGTDPLLWDGVRSALPKLFTALANGKVPDADRKAIADLLSHMPAAEDVVTVSASGHVLPAKPAAPPRKTEAPEKALTPAELMKNAKERFVVGLGWTLAGYDKKVDSYDKFLREAVATYNRPTFQAFLKKLLEKRREKYLPTLKVVSAAGFPAGSLAIQGSMTLDSEAMWEYSARTHFEGHPKTPPVKETFSLTLVVIPDGDRTWVAFGADPKALKDKFDAVKSGAPASGTLASRDGLDAVKSGPNTSAGFLSMSSLLMSARHSVASVFSAREMKMVEGALDAMPNKGTMPILILDNSTGGPTPTTSMELRAQKGTVDDLAALVSYAIAMKMQHQSDLDAPPATPPPPVSAPVGVTKKKK